jgi:translation initiation factor 2B subunit (eIF-2B alpha/beta/delta family)
VTHNRNTRNTKKTPVVTAFVWDEQRVLLALRSEQVSTFPGHWAGISGYLEGDDAAAWALVEIEEETGVLRGQLTLRRVGEPLEATDTASGRIFVVHPFLFSVEKGVAVRSDWEANRMEWVDVDDMVNRSRTPAVPRLYDAFDRVWPPWSLDETLGANLKLALDWLKTDRQMGAGTLARCAGVEAIKLARLCPHDEFALFRTKLGEAIDSLRVVRPSMTPPANLMQDFRNALNQADSKPQFLDVAERLVDQSREAEERLARNVADRIPAGTCVMTISYSSTVCRALRAAADRLRRVYVCEGRPLCEGRQLANELSEAGIAVTLLTEAQVHLLMPQADMILLGADSVIPGQGVVNKVGSALLALAARRCDKPVVVAAESLKQVRDGQDGTPRMECGAIEEVWQDAPAGIEVSNVYFELIPRETIAEYMDESGESTRGTLLD